LSATPAKAVMEILQPRQILVFNQLADRLRGKLDGEGKSLFKREKTV
jgi:hypothetical protein